MCMKTEPVILVRDASLASERDGAPAIYWAPQNTWQAFRGVSGINLAWRVFSVNEPTTGVSTGDVRARVFAQTSLDGVTWDDLSSGSNGLIPAGISDANASGATLIYTGGAIADAPYARFGVQVEDVGVAIPVEIRLTLVATAVQSGGNITLAYGDDIMSMTTVNPIGPVFATSGVDQVSVFGELRSVTGGSPDYVIMRLYTSASVDGPWVDSKVDLKLGTGTTIPSSDVISVDKTLLSAFAQLRFVSLTGLTAGLLYATATVRHC